MADSRKKTSRSRAPEYFLPVAKLYQLLDYIQVTDLDAKQLCANAGLDITKLANSSPDQEFPAIYYSNLYLEAVKAMEARHPVVPWAAGMGTEVFRMLWCTIIHCKTLEEALKRAEEFHHAVQRFSGHQLSLHQKGDLATVEYRLDIAMALPICAPPEWERALFLDAVAQSSGLRTWCSMLGWLVGRSLDISEVKVAAPPVSDEYRTMLEQHFNCPVEFGAETTSLSFPANQLELRVVQTPYSLEHLLGHAVYQYWMEDPNSGSTTLAIRSLIRGAPEGQMPSFEQVADRLHMSTSTLRRRLMEENTTYQQLKDECREAAAIEYLVQRQLKIHEIATLLGFSEAASFVRSFRNWTGMSPKEYRDAALELAIS
ncbi:MAG: helix-turn-helix domain-containing protein [Halieaceae bacterium]|jgi:AraC-like DNA-binding protein|nr:helix-turn-helix domain-containing protein [Halieaceae bacterium]